MRANAPLAYDFDAAVALVGVLAERDASRDVEKGERVIDAETLGGPITF